MSTRVKRVEEVMTHALRELFLYEVNDPRLQGIDITSVQMTPDLRLAYVRFVIGGPGAPRDDAREREAVKGFQKVTPFLRHQLAEKIILKYSPDLKFFYDEGLEKEMRIERLLSDIKKEDTPAD